jgi:hypothetical protein
LGDFSPNLVTLPNAQRLARLGLKLAENRFFISGSKKIIGWRRESTACLVRIVVHMHAAKMNVLSDAHKLSVEVSSIDVQGGSTCIPTKATT